MLHHSDKIDILTTIVKISIIVDVGGETIESNRNDSQKIQAG